jgi:hypothetical protein
MTTQVNLDLIWGGNDTGIVDTGDAKYTLGWVSEIPSYQNFNFVLQNATQNQLVLAEFGNWQWQTEITYQKGASVLEGGITYYSLVDSNTANQPSLDTARDYWGFGLGFGAGGTASHINAKGITINDINWRPGATVWTGNDFTLENTSTIMQFSTSSGSEKNWLLGNVSGEMVVVDVDFVTAPDGRSIALAAAGTHRLFHEGHPPTQSEVANTIPANLVNGVPYLRQDTSWIQGLRATDKATGASIDTGTNNTTYVTPQALTDSGMSKSKASGADVDAGTNDDRYVTSKAVADSDLIKASDVIDLVRPVGSIYESVSPTNPGTLWAGTVWSAFGTGRVTVGIDAGDASFNTVEEVGGSKNAINVAHSHNITDPGHFHTISPLSIVNRGSDSGGAPRWNDDNSTNTTTKTTGISINESGSSGTNANLQPYIVVYRWKRVS